MSHPLADGHGLEDIAARWHERAAAMRHRVVVCAGTGCVANGAMPIVEAFEAAIAATGLKVEVALQDCLESSDGSSESDAVHLSRSGCQGFCQMGPLVMIEPAGLLYAKVEPEDVAIIVERSILADEVVDKLLYKDPVSKKRQRGVAEIGFYAQQERRVLEQCGRLDPADLDEYIAHQGYRAAWRAYRELEPAAICQEVLDAGLRGRGGGGFPTGRKWQLALAQPAKKKYLVCNGDEGDPGAFMDRSLMEGNPHAVIEGMMIAARGIGADEGIIYVRAEYPLAVERMRAAVEHARSAGILGDDALGCGQRFDLWIMEGAGAFVCGEETALLASVEGRRGMPRPRPPFPAERGLWDCPTIINNVETLAAVVLILRDGVEAFRSVGTEGSPGTKTFALTGHVANTGLIEVPFGTSLRTIVDEIGGGVTNAQGRRLKGGPKAVQIGGPSGGCLTGDELDLPLDFDSLQSVGAMVGSGGLVVMNERTCMVKVARYFMQFAQEESCGKCVLCREGTKQMLVLLDDVIEGRGSDETLQLLERLAHVVRKGSLCGLGKTAPNPVLSTLRSFREEVEAHIHDKRCPAGECSALTPPHIDAERCKGCGLCKPACPVEAIHGERKQLHHIDADACLRCGACASTCRLDAIFGVAA